MYSNNMEFRITRLRERGRILPRYQTSFRHSGPWKIYIRDYHDEIGHRHFRRAVALDPRTGQESTKVPALLDAQVIHMESDYMIIVGFERLPDEGLGEMLFDYQQTWYVAIESDFAIQN